MKLNKIKFSFHDAFREHAIRSMVGTSGRQRVQVEMLEAYPLNKFKPEVMSEFHSTAHALFQKIKGNSAEINSLTQTRDTLLPKLMSGEINVLQAAKTGAYEPEQVLS